MVEQSENRLNEKTYSEQFSDLKEWFGKAVEKGTNSGIEYHNKVFKSPDSEVYQEFADEEMIRDISENFNRMWVGRTTNGRT